MVFTSLKTTKTEELYIEENGYNYKTCEWEGTGRGTGCG